jgi:hypothetical protein
MSLSLEILRNVDKVVYNYIELISKKYNLNKSELVCLWSGEEDKNETKKIHNVDEDKLKNMKKPEIVQLCRDRGLKCSGTKEQLISQLLSCSSEEQPTNNKVVLSKLQQFIPANFIIQNSFGNYEHKETGLVLDKNKIVIGRQNDDGTINNDLSAEDIEECHRYKLDYRYSDNLSVKSLDEDGEEEFDEEELLEEETLDEEEEELLEEEELYE